MERRGFGSVYCDVVVGALKKMRSRSDDAMVTINVSVCIRRSAIRRRTVGSVIRKIMDWVVGGGRSSIIIIII